nr:1-phosphofructokinase [Actinomycetes bacterium]
MAIVVVNPNPVFDRTIVVERLIPGTVMRTLEVEVTAGGKGVNVARALRALQVPVTLIAPVGRDDGQRYERLLSEEGADVEALEVSGFVRIASIYRESASHRVTVVNDAGHRLPEAEWDAFVEFATARVQSDDLVLVMGSLPAGLPDDAAA